MHSLAFIAISALVSTAVFGTEAAYTKYTQIELIRYRSDYDQRIEYSHWRK